MLADAHYANRPIPGSDDIGFISAYLTPEDDPSLRRPILVVCVGENAGDYRDVSWSRVSRWFADLPPSEFADKAIHIALYGSSQK